MPVGNDNIQLPTLQIPVELDMDAGRQALRELERETKRSGDKSAESLSGASGETKRWTDRLKDAASAAGGLAVLVGGRLISGLRGVAGVVGRTTSLFVDFAAVGILGVSRGLRRLDDELEDNGRGWKFMGDAAGAAATGLEKGAQALMTVSNLLLGMKVAAAAATAALVIMAHRAASEFAPGFNRVRTLLGDTTPLLYQFRGQINQLAADVGVAGEVANETLYEIISAMPELAKEPARALEVLRVALETGSTGFAEASEAASATTAILNAFGKEAEDAREVSDALFATQKQGVTTFGEVAGSIGRVAGLAASLNADYRDLLGITATLTKNGQDTAEVFTQIRAAMNNILKPSADAKKAAKQMGIDFSTTAVRTKGLNGFLLDLIEITEGRPEALARFFGSQEALNLVIGLAGATDELRQKTDEINHSAGLTAETVETMNDSWQRQKEILAHELKAELREVGFVFDELGAKGLSAVNGILRALRALRRSNPSDWFPAVYEPYLEFQERAGNRMARGDVDIMGRRRQLEQLQRKHISRRASEGLSELVGDLEIERDLFPAGSPEQQQFVELLEKARKRLDFVNQGLRDHVPAAEDAADADAGLIERQRELEDLMFAGRQAQPSAGGPGVDPSAAEPTSIAYSQSKIADSRALAQMRAVAELANTGDMDAYNEALRESQVATNALVSAEMKRLRAAGVSEKEIAKLASSYTLLKEETDRAAEARSRFGQQLVDHFFRLTADATELQMRQLDQLEAKAHETYGEKLPQWAEEGFALARQAAEGAGVLDSLQEDFRQLQRLDPSAGSVDAMRQLVDQVRAEAEALPENLQLREDYLALIEAIEDAIKRVNDQLATQAEREAKAAGQEAKRAREEELRQLRERARTLEENARATLQLANAMGVLDDETARALESLVQLGTAVARVAGGDLTAIPAAVASAGSLISGLVGEGPEQKAQRQAMEENNRRLQELALGIGKLSSALQGISGNVFTGVEQALTNTINAIGDDPGIVVFGEVPDTVRGELHKLGLTMDDLEAVASALGIEFDGTAKSALAVLEALQQIQLDQLFETYAGQLEMLQLEFDMFDIDDPIAQLQRILEVFEEFTGMDVPEFDLATDEGRQAAEAWIQDMYRRLRAGEITPEDLGGMSLDQFLQFLADYERRLDEAEGGGVVGATDSTRMSVNITAAQSSQLISLDVTRNRYLEQMVGLLGGAPAMAAMSAPTPAAVGVGGAAINTYVTLEEGAVQIPISTTGGISREDGRRAGAAAGAAAGDALAQRLAQMHRAAGGRGAPKVVQEEGRR